MIKHEIYNVCICFNSEKLYNIFKGKVISKFDNYRIYICNELGNDIVPTLLMYDDIIGIYKPEHIIKLQTKSTYKIMEELTGYVLSVPINILLKEKIVGSNTIGNVKYYIRLKEDNFNKDLYMKHEGIIDEGKIFIGATIFYIRGSKMEDVIKFVKDNNYRGYMLNNMYDSNRIVIDRSHVHFLERLFGVMK